MGILVGLLVFLAFVGGQAIDSHTEAVSSIVTYWHQKLPTTPIPSALEELISYETGRGGFPGDEAEGEAEAAGRRGVNLRTPGTKDILSLDRSFLWNHGADAPMLADPSLYMFFLEKDLHPGTKMKLHLAKLSTAPRTYFLPRSVADKIPFSSDKLSAATKALKVSEGSDVALAMKETLKDCESPTLRGENNYCATSLESMVDYATGRLGTNSVKVMVTDVGKDSVKQNYTITAIVFQSKPGAKSVACHSQTYAYAVFYCHEIKGTKTVQVSLKGEDGSSGQAVVVCHADTSAWNPNHVVFKVLDVKPGGPAVCHFIPEDHVVWLPAN